MKQAIIYKGDFAYDLGNAFGQEMASGLNTCDYETVFFDLRDPAQRQLLSDRKFYEDYDLIFSINAICPFVSKDDFRFYRDTGCVFFSMLIDPPLLQYPRLFMNNDILTCIDRSHLRFLKKYFPEIKAQPQLLLHGGSVPSEPTSPNNRQYNVIFPGTFNPPETTFEKIMSLPLSIKDTLMEAADILLTSDTVTTFDALELVMSRSGINLADNKLVFRLLITYYPLLNKFIRLEKRIRCLRSLDQAGIKVDIWGNNWPDNMFKNHVIHPAVSYNEMNRIMTQAKIVLDLGFYEDGSHERIFTAMLSGAVALAMENNYHQENFTDNEDIILYKFPEFNKLPIRLSGLLENDEKRMQIAEAGRIKAEQNHTWQHRAKTVLDYVNEFKKNYPR